MKIAIWTSLPNHYQAEFFSGLRSGGVDVCVRYLSRVRPDRECMGWDSFDKLPSGEAYVQTERLLDSLEDWRTRLHVFSGYRTARLRQLTSQLCASGAAWVHWSEPSHPGLKWLLSYPLKRWYAQCINSHALGAFGIGERATRDFRRWGVRADKTAFLPYSNVSMNADGPLDPECERFRQGRFTILFSGSLCRRKGVDVLLRAFASVVRSREANLLLVGNDTPGRDFARLARRAGVEPRVLFRGPVKPSELASVYRSADVFCLPSRYDGWGVALGEAASAGLPLIGTESTGAARHLIIPGENGFRVQTGNVKDLAQAIHRYLDDRQMAVSHGKASLELFKSYSSSANAQRFIHAIHGWHAAALDAAA